MILHNVKENYEEYLGDESRLKGKADSISFPQSEEELMEIISYLHEQGVPTTIQGGRTGITGGAVPRGGHILNLSRMNRILGLSYRKTVDKFYLTVQPGVLLEQVNEVLGNKEFDTSEWDKSSLIALKLFRDKGRFFFLPDPTETTASIGGMAACNASGARSFFYGSIRAYIEALRIVLHDGSRILIRRGEHAASGVNFCIKSESGNLIQGELPRYKMPETKNAAGFYSSANMDLLDLFIGSEGTLGVISQLEIRLDPYPEEVWGIMAFFPDEITAVRFVMAARGETLPCINTRIDEKPAAIEFFDHNALDLLRDQKEKNPAFSEIPGIPGEYHTAIYVEYHGDNEDSVSAAVETMAELMVECGGNEDSTWIATTSRELERLKNFRHSLPEAVNLLIDEYRKKDPELTKLGTDMAVPDKELNNILALYHRDLDNSGLEHVMFGHIGNNHIHVNIIPHSIEEYEKGRELYRKWAQEVIDSGGTISAEHGIGKLKVDLLRKMYGDEGIEGMQRLIQAFNPYFLLNRGNMVIPPGV